MILVVLRLSSGQQNPRVVGLIAISQLSVKMTVIIASGINLLFFEDRKDCGDCQL